MSLKTINEFLCHNTLPQSQIRYEIQMKDPDLTEDILAIVKAHPEIDTDSIEKSTKLREELGIDSLVIAEIAIEIEDKYDFQFPNDAIGKINSIADVISQVECCLKK